MKLLSKNLLEAMSDTEFEKLTSQVEEILALDTKIDTSKKDSSIFTTAQLWNIQRQRKSSFSRRYF